VWDLEGRMPYSGLDVQGFEFRVEREEFRVKRV
jgi:hypothetical protein